MPKSAQTRRILSFCYAADSASFFRVNSSNNHLNAWTSIPRYYREAYLSEARQLKSKNKISDLIDEFRELGDLYNSVVWLCLDPNMTLAESSKALRIALNISKTGFDIDQVIDNLLSDSDVYKCTPLNYVAALLCCLRYTYNKKKLYPTLCVRLARSILMLNASNIDRYAAAHIWECCDLYLVKKFKFDGCIISFNEKTRNYAGEYITSLIGAVNENMFLDQELKHIPSVEFKRELIRYFVDELINIDPDRTKRILLSIKSIANANNQSPRRKIFALNNIDSSDIGVVRYL